MLCIGGKGKLSKLRMLYIGGKGKLTKLRKLRYVNRKNVDSDGMAMCFPVFCQQQKSSVQSKPKYNSATNV